MVFVYAILGQPSNIKSGRSRLCNKWYAPQTTVYTRRVMANFDGW